ncbi:hypothetical protein [Nocardia huaxiensis]|uniref:Uncharacterized protein n=1 Tax=Nocardia huaxiensis TaxID=2755382 RepID=A0A7D6V9M5_9NOCA|nr:hypothetical protein [Nocardia huaxiensis]QLY29022.1 hypothetical protein H0264_27410 [Nocardia huaxiensis]UFS97495.1 hypothetical protein LPY97_06195 [Nocardia huaxiensis]
MIRLRRQRRSLAIASALMMAAAALVAVSMPAAAESEDIFVYGDYLRHDSTHLVCAGGQGSAAPLTTVA